MSQSICGIDLKAFTKQPTPEELAAIVARWTDQQQADFLLSFGEQLRFCCGGRQAMQWQYIANTIKETELRLCDGSASQLIDELHQRLFDKAA